MHQSIFGCRQPTCSLRLRRDASPSTEQVGFCASNPSTPGKFYIFLFRRMYPDNLMWQRWHGNNERGPYGTISAGVGHGRSRTSGRSAWGVFRKPRTWANNLLKMYRNLALSLRAIIFSFCPLIFARSPPYVPTGAVSPVSTWATNLTTKMYCNLTIALRHYI